jgi:RNA polymerase sigma-70 factor (ECF subfamily)
MDPLGLLLQNRWELYGFIRALVRNTHDAEDVFQEVAATVVKKAQQGTEIRDFRAWSHEVARMCVLAHFRRRGSRAKAPVEEMRLLVEELTLDPAHGPETSLAESEALWRCLEKLPARSRALLEMRFVADRSYEEIARDLRASVAAVRRAAARARLALLSCVERRLRHAPEAVS